MERKKGMVKEKNERRKVKIMEHGREDEEDIKENNSEEGKIKQ